MKIRTVIIASLAVLSPACAPISPSMPPAHAYPGGSTGSPGQAVNLDSRNLSTQHATSGAKVTLAMMGSASSKPFQLGPRSSKLFLDMLTKQPVRSEISQMRALPMGTFTAGGLEYLWHGNGVIRGTGTNERLWHGPYLQRLIAEMMSNEHSTRESVQRILDNLEGDPTIATIPVAGPGAYPGGGDALHPVRPGDPAGWGVFTPPPAKP